MSSFTVLMTLDNAKTQLYHFTTIVIAGMGFFTDAYDIFCVAAVGRLLGRLYYYDPANNKPGRMPANVSAAVNSMAVFGTVVGHVFFGWLGDRMGRKKVYGVALLLMTVGSLGSALSFGNTAKSVIATLCFCRFWLGFGIGGDYPLSAIIMSEYSNKATRGAFIAAVFAMQGFGILTAATVSIILASVFRRAYPRPTFDDDPIASTPPQADFLWRIVFFLGAIPALFTFYFRMRMPETARYTALVAGDHKQAAVDMGLVLDTKFDDDSHLDEFQRKLYLANNSRYGFWSERFLQRHGRQLFGCCSCWFLLDVVFYSQNLFQKYVFFDVGWIPPNHTMSALEEVYRIAKAQALLAAASTVPGYWLTVLSVEKLGRKTIQMQGFFMTTVLLLALSFNYNQMRGHACDNDPNTLCGGSRAAFLVLYALTFFFTSFGPNTTTFIIPAELFPARLRTTCHGIAASFGKVGAVLGTYGFLYIGQNQHNPEPGFRAGIGMKNCLLILAVVSMTGLVCTIFFVPETKSRSLEELSGENEDLDPSTSRDLKISSPVSVQRHTFDGQLFHTNDSLHHL